MPFKADKDSNEVRWSDSPAPDAPSVHAVSYFVRVKGWGGYPDGAVPVRAIKALSEAITGGAATTAADIAAIANRKLAEPEKCPHCGKGNIHYFATGRKPPTDHSAWECHDCGKVLADA